MVRLPVTRVPMEKLIEEKDEAEEETVTHGSRIRTKQSGDGIETIIEPSLDFLTLLRQKSKSVDETNLIN